MVGQQQPDGSEIKYSSVWEGQNPNADMEFAAEVSALRRYGQILVASYNTAVVSSCATGKLNMETQELQCGTVCWGLAFMGLALIPKWKEY